MRVCVYVGGIGLNGRALKENSLPGPDDFLATGMRWTQGGHASLRSLEKVLPKR